MVDVFDGYFREKGESLVCEKTTNKILGSLQQNQSMEAKKEADEKIRQKIQKEKEE